MECYVSFMRPCTLLWLSSQLHYLDSLFEEGIKEEDKEEKVFCFEDPLKKEKKENTFIW